MLLDNINREQLHERFLEVFALLQQKGEIVASDRERGFSALAEHIFDDRRCGHLFQKFIDRKRKITLDQATNFCKYFKINPDFLLQGKGDPFAPLVDFAAEPVAGGARGSILFTNVQALASTALDIQLHEEVEFFGIPGMPGEFVAFYIKGNSMQPTILDGDMVICRHLDSNENVRDNDIYAIITNAGVMVKRLQRIVNKNNQIIKFKLISDNYLEHDPIVINRSDIRQFLKVERRMTPLNR